MLASHQGKPSRVQVHGRRKKDGQKALHHQLIELQFRFTQAAGHMGGGDDGKVIADFFIVEDAAVKFQVAFGQRLVRKGSEVPAALALHGFFDSTQVVFGKKWLSVRG